MPFRFPVVEISVTASIVAMFIAIQYGMAAPEVVGDPIALPDGSRIFAIRGVGLSLRDAAGKEIGRWRVPFGSDSQDPDTLLRYAAEMGTLMTADREREWTEEVAVAD